MLSVLEEKLAEAHALAIAADVVTAKVLERTADGPLRQELLQLGHDAAETRARCLAVEGALGEETQIELLHHVSTTRSKAADLAGAWFKAGTTPIAAWTFLAMGEAGEVAAWSAVAELAATAHDRPIGELAAWALEVQRAHLDAALAGAARLARLADPAARAWG